MSNQGSLRTHEAILTEKFFEIEESHVITNTIYSQLKLNGD